jgi:hypothetical protein
VGGQIGDCSGGQQGVVVCVGGGEARVCLLGGRGRQQHVIVVVVGSNARSGVCALVRQVRIEWLCVPCKKC